MKRWTAPIVSLCLALLIGVGGIMARAREPHANRVDPAAPTAIGSVDMDEVYNASGGPQELEQSARQHEADGAQRINKIMTVPYLEAPELEEYGNLIGKLKLTPDEEKRTAALKSLSDQRSAEVTVFEGKPNGSLSADDKARLSHLSGLKQTLLSQVRPGLVADFRAQQESWIAEFRHRQMLQLRQEVAKAAKEKGISHVFDSSALVFSVNDVTQFVEQRLSKRRRPGE